MLCACGQIARFGELCWECRDVAIRRVLIRNGGPQAMNPKNQNPQSHKTRDLRRDDPHTRSKERLT